MEEEVPYSSVFFIKSEEDKSKGEPNAEQAVYTEVKKNEVHTSQTKSNPATVANNDTPVLGSQSNDQSLPDPQRYLYAMVVLGLLTALLLSALVAVLVYYGNNVSEYNTLVAHLHSEVSQLQQQKKSLTMERDHLNQTVEVIFQFSVFEVDHFCPKLDHAKQERTCSVHCEKGWVYYQSSCYLFIYQYPWKTWEECRHDCAQRGAQLVTVDDIEEQAFINNHTTFYYDKWHGYWIGLKKIQDKWQWVNGSELTIGYWRGVRWYEPCALTMPDTEPLESWGEAACTMKNRWICEMEAAMWPE